MNPHGNQFPRQKEGGEYMERAWREGERGGRTGKYGEVWGSMGNPPQFARNDGVLAVNSKAEKFERVRLAHFPPRVKENLTEFLEKFP